MRKEIKIQRAIELLTEEGYQISPPLSKSVEIAVIQPPVLVQDDYPLQEALNVWLDYKREKRQTYKPAGLKCVKKKLMQLSGGDPELAIEIVEGCMANNYAGLFPLNRMNNGKLTKQEAIARVAESASTSYEGRESSEMERTIPKPF